MPRPQRHVRYEPAPADRVKLLASTWARGADDADQSQIAELHHARALQQQLIHRFERGEFELPAVRRYPPAVRLILLLSATASLWWSLYVLSRVALG